MEQNKHYKEIIKKLNSNEDKGLSSDEVKVRQEKYGPNELTGQKHSSFFMKFISQFADFLVIILIIFTQP